MRSFLIEYSSLELAFLRTLFARLLSGLSSLLRRRRDSRDQIVARGERLAVLMAQQKHLMTLMLAKHHPLATANAIAGEARQFMALMAEIESTARDVRNVPALQDATDRLLDAALSAAEFAQSVSAWRSVDMAAWHRTTRACASERVRFRNELDALANGGLSLIKVSPAR